VRRVYARSPNLALLASSQVRGEAVPDTADKDRPNAGDGAMGEARLLRVLSGPHLGAEMSLRPGRYAIGTDDDCDIVLSDSRLAPRHAFLIVSDDQVSVEPGDGAVTVDGAQIDGRVVVADFAPVLMGATALALGPANGPWPEIALTRPESPPANGADGDLAAAPATAVAATEAPSDDTAAAPPAPVPVAATGAAATRGAWEPWPRGAVALALILAAGGFGAYLWNARHDATARPTAEALTPLAQVQAVVGQLGFGSALQVSEASGSGDDRVLVQGYLDTEVQRRELISALQPMLGKVNVRVWSTALLDDAIRQALAGMRLQLDVYGVADGKVTLTGVLPPSISRDRLEQNLQRDVPGIASIDLQVVSIADAIQWLRDQSAGIGIPDQTLSITRQGDSLAVAGRLDAGKEGAWRDLTSAFGQRFGAKLSLQDDVTFAAAAPKPVAITPTFDFSIRAINLGPPAYITLDSDAKYLVGSRLDNGMILEEIKPNGMVLRDGETRHLVEIAQDSGRVTNVRKLETD
jgi:type III secretion system YscD/HrpQ family protein